MVDRGGMFVPLDSAGNGMSALDGRYALGGLIGTTARCISGGTITASATNMVFTIARAVFQLPDADNVGAVTLSPLDQQALPAIPVGPSSGSRIDSIIVRQRITGSLGDTTSYAVYATVQGTASTGTPASPTIPTGWYEYARVTVPTNASTASACSVQVLYPATIARLPITAASKAALQLTTGEFVGQRGYTGSEEYRWNGTGWILERGDGTSALSLPGTVTNLGGNDITSVTRDGTAATLNLAVNVGSSGLSQGGAVLGLPDGYQGATNQNQWFSAIVFDTSNSQAGVALLRVIGAAVVFWSWATLNGTLYTAFSANYRLIGGHRYRATA